MFDSRRVGIIAEAAESLESYIEKEHYRGYDPYDVLRSPIFRLPILRSSKIIRFGVQQVFRRIPFNLRPLLGITKGLSPVTLGCCLQGYSYSVIEKPEKRDLYLGKGDELVSVLDGLQSAGYSGACWGYEFDWQGRYANIPAGTPTVVATGFITNGLFEYYKATGNRDAFRLCESATGFVLRDLHRSCEGETFCFSYSPVDSQRVFNASMKGARLLVQVYSVNGNTELVSAARGATEYVVKQQRPDGSWGYSAGDARTWADNHHTAYVLDCLDEYMKLSGDTRHKAALDRGLAYYRSNFFDGPVPKFFDNKKYPVDSTALAQSILTLVRFGDIEKAAEVAQWGIQHMRDVEGYWYYQKKRLYMHPTSYMRWSNGWMYCALRSLSRALRS